MQVFNETRLNYRHDSRLSDYSDIRAQVSQLHTTCVISAQVKNSIASLKRTTKQFLMLIM